MKAKVKATGKVVDALTDNMISCMKIHEESYKKLVKRIRLMPEIKKKYDFVAKNKTSVESEYFCAGFVEGAEWRINSIWHDVSEEPQGNNELLILNSKGVAYVIKSYVWKTEVKIFSIVKWAYIKDLIPTED